MYTYTECARCDRRATDYDFCAAHYAEFLREWACACGTVNGAKVLCCATCGRVHDIEAAEALNLRTADGVRIVHGMAVWDYDLRAGLIDLTNARREYGGAVWFHVVPSIADLGTRRGSLMDSTRVCVVHPFDRVRAEL